MGNADETRSLLGKSLGHYDIVELIGAGGMASVFKATQPALNRFVAIKVLPATKERDSLSAARFAREASSVARVSHPNILPLYDYGEQDGLTYLVMEYVDGGSLGDQLRKRGPLSIADAADYVIQAAEGLDCAHRNGIVHRDVKPANMLLRSDGRLLLSDFGIAKLLGDTTALTQTGVSIGTPRYISPEQATGQSVDARSDIYSLGIVMFQCLTGHIPFSADNPLTLILKHLNEPLPTDLLDAKGVPPEITQVVLKMTAKAPADRYRSMREVITALTEALTARIITLPSRHAEVQESVIPPDQSPPFSESPSLADSHMEGGEQPGVDEASPHAQRASSGLSTALFPEAILTQQRLSDFFIMYHRADRPWAKWIAWQLDGAGYSIILPLWSIRSDSDFEMEMRKATAKAKRAIVVLSPDYLNALSTGASYLAAFGREAMNEQSRLLPISVRACGRKFSKLLESINPVDLVGEDEPTALTLLLAGVRNESIKLTTPPAFPARVVSDSMETEPGFPNRALMRRESSTETTTDVPIKAPLSPRPFPRQGLKVFFSYSHKDKKLRGELEKYLNHLKRQQLIVGWHDGEIGAGTEYAQEIAKQLSEAHIILLLISQDFIASDYCYNIEMQKALERHEAGEACVIPIIVRPAFWEHTPLGKLQALPTDGRPITHWPSRERALMDVVQGIQREVDRLMKHSEETEKRHLPLP